MPDMSPPYRRLLQQYDIVAPRHFAAATLVRLLEQEPRPDRRSALVGAFGGRIVRVPGGAGHCLMVLVVDECAVCLSVPTGPKADPRTRPLRPECRQVIRKVPERDAFVGVGHTYALDPITGGTP